MQPCTQGSSMYSRVTCYSRPNQRSRSLVELAHGMYMHLSCCWAAQYILTYISRMPKTQHQYIQGVQLTSIKKVNPLFETCKWFIQIVIFENEGCLCIQIQRAKLNCISPSKMVLLTSMSLTKKESGTFSLFVIIPKK